MEFIINNQQTFDENLITKYASEFGLHKDVIRLLFCRGITQKEQITEFLHPSLSAFYDPFKLKNMTEVVARIKQAISDNKRIVILGDYDTDGISASAILYKYFKSKGVNVNVFLPNRLLDGYGLTIETLDKIFTLYNPELIITVDCGISCATEVDYCLSKGVDIIVTDHHDIPDTIPNTLVINAKLPNQEYPFSELCGAGVAFKLVQALGGLDEALDYITIASLATVADIVPLVDENRAIVFYGLKNQDNLPFGLKQLCKTLKISMPLCSTDIAYKLAPKINASGRMGDASVSFKLYVEENKKLVSEYIAELLEINEHRVSETNIIYESALEKLANVNISKLGAITLYDEKWESGVLGIICSKLVEKFNKPVCLLSIVDGEFKGSCRSISGISITDILNKLKHLLIRFGGHNQAGGLSVTRENIDEFCNQFNNEVLQNYSQYLLPTPKTYDMEVTAPVSIDLLDDLQKLEPFGLANETPIFKVTLPPNTLAQRMPNHPNHLKLKAYNIEILGFSLGEYYNNFNSNCRKDLLCNLYCETYNKRKQIKATIRSMHFSSLNTLKNKETALANYLLTFLAKLNTPKTLVNNRVKLLKAKTWIQEVNELTKKAFGTLIVANNFDSYKKCINKIKNIYNYELYSINDEKGLNTIVLSPENIKNFKNYTNVVFLDFPLCDEYIYNLPNENIFVVDKEYPFNSLTTISNSRDIFALYHNAIKVAIKVDTRAINMYDYYTKLRALNPQISLLRYDQFVFVYMVLTELKIISKTNEFSLQYNSGVKEQLNNSSIYNAISCLIKKDRLWILLIK